MLHRGKCNSVKDKHYLKVKGWKTVFQANGPRKQAGVDILISNEIDFQPKVIKKDTEGHFILIKGKKSIKKNSQSKHLCSKYKGTLIHKRNFTKA